MVSWRVYQEIEPQDVASAIRDRIGSTAGADWKAPDLQARFLIFRVYAEWENKEIDELTEEVLREISQDESWRMMALLSAASTHAHKRASRWLLWLLPTLFLGFMALGALLTLLIQALV